MRKVWAFKRKVLNSATGENRFKMLSDLFHYYEDDLYWGSRISR